MSKRYSRTKDHFKPPRDEYQSTLRIIKSSAMVSLVLVGAIVWSLFTPEESDRDEEVRLLYSNREDCAADWNTNCEPASGNTTSTGSGSYYRGPLMRQNSARSNRSIGREVVRRGGFGGMGRFFSRGG